MFTILFHVIHEDKYFYGRKKNVWEKNQPALHPGFMSHTAMEVVTPAEERVLYLGSYGSAEDLTTALILLGAVGTEYSSTSADMLMDFKALRRRGASLTTNLLTDVYAHHGTSAKDRAIAMTAYRPCVCTLFSHVIHSFLM